MSYGNGKTSMMNHQGEDGNVKKGSGSVDLVSVTIDNVPMGVNGGQLRDAMCGFGELKAISVTAGYNGLSSYHVEFKVIRVLILFYISVHVGAHMSG
jgi:hypothetical protein